MLEIMGFTDSAAGANSDELSLTLILSIHLGPRAGLGCEAVRFSLDTAIHTDAIG